LPIYEYQCSKCGHRFEQIQKFSDPPAKKCPECGGKVEQVISAPAVQFKGSGWYVTDYARKGSSGGNSGKKESSAGESKSGDKAESKSESKTESKTSSEKKS
jgi:putative FmdB family regulatory protein